MACPHSLPQRGGKQPFVSPSFPVHSGGGVWLALTLYRKVVTLNIRSCSPGFPARTGGGVWFALTLYRKGAGKQLFVSRLPSSCWRGRLACPHSLPQRYNRNNRSSPGFPARAGGSRSVSLTLYRKGGSKQPFVFRLPSSCWRESLGFPHSLPQRGGVNNRSCPGFPVRAGGGVWFALTLYRKGGSKQPFVSRLPSSFWRGRLVCPHSLP